MFLITKNKKARHFFENGEILHGLSLLELDMEF